MWPGSVSDGNVFLSEQSLSGSGKRHPLITEAMIDAYQTKRRELEGGLRATQESLSGDAVRELLEAVFVAGNQSDHKHPECLSDEIVEAAADAILPDMISDRIMPWNNKEARRRVARAVIGRYLRVMGFDTNCYALGEPKAE